MFRYTALLLQHHAALTAGLLELYSRLLNGERWEGSPVDELNGSPSVHCILERLGVIESEDYVNENTEPGIKLEPLSPGHVEQTTPLPSSAPRKDSGVADLELRFSAPSPGPVGRSKSSSAIKPPLPSLLTTDEEMQSTRLPQLPSPLSCRSGSGSGPRCLSQTYSSPTATQWDSPFFDDEFFITPIPTPTASYNFASQAYELQFESQTQKQQQQQQQQNRYSEFAGSSLFQTAGAASPPNYTQPSCTRNQFPSQEQGGLQMQYNTTELEAYSSGTEFLLDATSGMGGYIWDSTSGDINGGGFGPFVTGQDYRG